MRGTNSEPGSQVELRRRNEHRSAPITCRDGKMIEVGNLVKKSRDARLIAHIDEAARRAGQAFDGRIDRRLLTGCNDDIRLQRLGHFGHRKTDARSSSNDDHCFSANDIASITLVLLDNDTKAHSLSTWPSRSGRGGAIGQDQELAVCPPAVAQFKRRAPFFHVESARHGHGEAPFGRQSFSDCGSASKLILRLCNASAQIVWSVTDNRSDSCRETERSCVAN